MYGAAVGAGRPVVVQRAFASSRLAPELVAVAYELLVPGDGPGGSSREPGSHCAPRSDTLRFHEPIAIGGGGP